MMLERGWSGLREAARPTAVKRRRLSERGIQERRIAAFLGKIRQVGTPKVSGNLHHL
jgi:hypothetical protein